MPECDVLIAGAGPAGIAAALCAREAGAAVTVIDDNPAPGGQIWRGGKTHRWLSRFERAGVRTLSSARIIAGDAERKTVLVETSGGEREFRFRKLILATGARELFLPFPGWTLPGVTGVGGLQALVKSGLPIRGKRIVVCGSGPLLLAAAAFFRKRGAQVRVIAEQAAPGAILPFVLGLTPAKLMEAARLRASLVGVPYRTECWVEAAEGNGVVDRVRLRCARRTWTEDCDFAAVAYGLYPNTEAAAIFACDVSTAGVVVNERQETSVADVFSAGECTGIGGVELSLVEGQIAGYAATGDTQRCERLASSRARARRFAERLRTAFALRPELRQLPQPETIVCRCEDVPFARLAASPCLRAAKLHARFGMGPCQGRICGAAADFLLGWRANSVRPPVFPSRLAALASQEDTRAEGA